MPSYKSRLPQVLPWLRLRTEERGSSINFKRRHSVDALVKAHPDEYESKIDHLAAVQRLLLWIVRVRYGR